MLFFAPLLQPLMLRMLNITVTGTITLIIEPLLFGAIRDFECKTGQFDLSLKRYKVRIVM